MTGISTKNELPNKAVDQAKQKQAIKLEKLAQQARASNPICNYQGNKNRGDK